MLGIQVTHNSFSKNSRMKAWMRWPISWRRSTRRQQGNLFFLRYLKAISHFLRQMMKPVCIPIYSITADCQTPVFSPRYPQWSLMQRDVACRVLVLSFRPRWFPKCVLYQHFYRRHHWRRFKFNPITGAHNICGYRGGSFEWRFVISSIA